MYAVARRSTYLLRPILLAYLSNMSLLSESTRFPVLVGTTILQLTSIPVLNVTGLTFSTITGHKIQSNPILKAIALIPTYSGVLVTNLGVWVYLVGS